MSTTSVDATADARGPIDRLLGVFSEVRAGKGVTALLMLFVPFYS